MYIIYDWLRGGGFGGGFGSVFGSGFGGGKPLSHGLVRQLNQ